MLQHHLVGCCATLSWKTLHIIENSIFISVHLSDRSAWKGQSRLCRSRAPISSQPPRTVGGSWDEKLSQLEAAKTDVQDFGSEVVVIELPCKVKHSNSAVLFQIDGASAAPRYFWILSKENCLHDEALKRCTPRTYLSVDSCEAPQRMSYTVFFFFSNCHSGLLTVCAQARVTPQPKGQTRILKVTLLEPNNPRLRADFFFYVLFFRGSVSPRRCHRHNAASEFPISLARMWRGCLIRLSSLAQTLWEMLGTFLHFYSKMHKPYNKRRRAMMWKSQHKT